MATKLGFKPTRFKPKNECKIIHCYYVLCGKCWYWHNPKDPKPHKCVERDKPNRDLSPYCPGCRANEGVWSRKSWDERDAYKTKLLKRTDRLVHLEENPRPNMRRPERQIRTTRATNAARTVR